MGGTARTRQSDEVGQERECFCVHVQAIIKNAPWYSRELRVLDGKGAA